MADKNSDLFESIRLRQKGLFILVILMLGWLGFLFWSRIYQPIKPELTSENPVIAIELEGEVRRPGLLMYLVPPTLEKVVRDGGGLVRNHLFSLSDQNQILVSDRRLRVEIEKNGRPIFQQTSLSSKALWILGRPISLNRAVAEDLDRLPGIGPALARQIIEFRQRIGRFSRLEDLKQVKGIKEKTFEKLKGYLTL